MTTIITNNQPRNLLYWEELTAKEQKEFDDVKLNDNDEDFIRYKGVAYRLADFMMANAAGMEDWDGIFHDTFFSGILIKFEDECVIMGRYYE